MKAQNMKKIIHAPADMCMLTGTLEKKSLLHLHPVKKKCRSSDIFMNCEDDDYKIFPIVCKLPSVKYSDTLILEWKFQSAMHCDEYQIV